MPLTTAALEKLQKAGFRTVSDLSDVKPIALSHELGIPIRESISIISVLKEASNNYENSEGIQNKGGHPLCPLQV